jgi:hypothetical protein
MSLHTLLDTLHTAILDKDARAAIPHIKHNPRLSPEQQLAIYIDGYRYRLIDAIRSDYPVLLAYLGEPAFNALARAYIDANPPTHFNLDRYPHAFAATVKDGFAADLAHLESAVAEVFMLPESAPLTPASLSALTPEAFASVVLHARSASKILRFDYPVENYFAARRAGENPAPPAPEPSYVCIVRHTNEVQRHTLSHPGYLLLERLRAGDTIEAAFDHIATHHPESVPDIAANIQPWFAYWTASGFFKAS